MNHSCDAPFNDLFFFHRRAYGLRHRLSTCRRYAADLRLSFYHLMAEALDYKTGRRYAADLRLSFYHLMAEALDYKTGRRYAADLRFSFYHLMAVPWITKLVAAMRLVFSQNRLCKRSQFSILHSQLFIK
jgi:hypothetical protein